MNVVLVVVDSLRARALQSRDGDAPRTPFLDRLSRETIAFRRAYASECWTLPAHLSMFTGLLPSQHGAHFQTMAYTGRAPTIAELLTRAGYQTEVITRNSLFDGSIVGATRGFRDNTRVLADLRGLSAAFAFLFALGKPRVRRVMRTSGFFSALQKERRDFVTMLACLGIPADRPVLGLALDRMAHQRRLGRPYFLFLNLYDVHAPYCPSPRSPLRSFRSAAGVIENLKLPFVLPYISSHAYLRPGFRLSDPNRRMLLGRYHRAIELMDEKLDDFYTSALSGGLLDDTLLIVTSDHGEAFGEHRLYFHDASVYDTHLHVPLWIRHPDLAPEVVDDVVGTRDLFGLIRAVAERAGLGGTILDRASRAARPIALAEHFHYPFTRGVLDCYTQNIAAAVVGPHKVVVRREGLEHYDLSRDPEERCPEGGAVDRFESACRRDGISAAAIATAAAHLRRWETTAAAA